MLDELIGERMVATEPTWAAVPRVRVGLENRGRGVA